MNGLNIFYFNTGFLAMSIKHNITNCIIFLEKFTDNKILLKDILAYYSIGMILAFFLNNLIQKYFGLKFVNNLNGYGLYICYILFIVSYYYLNKYSFFKIYIYTVLIFLGYFSSGFQIICSSIANSVDYKYTKIINLGTGYSGLIISLIMLLLKFIFSYFYDTTTDNKIFIIYNSIIAIHIIICIIFHINFNKYYFDEINNIIQNKDINAIKDNKVNNSFFYLFKKYFGDYFIGITFSNVISTSVIPNFIKVIYFDEFDNYKMEIMNIMYKGSDIIGKGGPNYFLKMTRNKIYIYNIVRGFLITIYFILLANQYKYKIDILNNPYFIFSMIFILGLTHGHLIAILMKNSTNNILYPSQKNTIGYYMVLGWLGGTFYSSICVNFYLN